VLSTAYSLADAASLDQLRKEFVDFQLSPADLPSPNMLISQRRSAVEDTRWKEQIQHNYYASFCTGLLSIPSSNADSERGFSILRKIHTDQRSNLDQSTITALMTMKFNCDDCCHDITINTELLSRKKATMKTLAKHCFVK